MALKKQIISSYGIPVEYWKIGRRVLDGITNEVHIELMPYIDEAHRRNGGSPFEKDAIKIDIYDGSPGGYDDEGNPITTHVFVDFFSPEVLVANGTNEVEAMYNYIKQNVEEFKDAEDC